MDIVSIFSFYTIQSLPLKLKFCETNWAVTRDIFALTTATLIIITIGIKILGNKNIRKNLLYFLQKSLIIMYSPKKNLSEAKKYI